MNLYLIVLIQKIAYILCNSNLSAPIAVKDGPYVINLDKYKSIGIHWIALYINGDNVTYIDCSGAEHIPKEIKEFIGNKGIKENFYRIQAYDSIMCGYFCVKFIDFMFKSKNLTNLTNLNNFKNNGNVMLNYFLN